MKRTSYLLAVWMLAAIGSLYARDSETKLSAGEDEVNAAHDDAKEMLGTYVGPFGVGKITICLDRIIGNSITGYSIVAGNERAFSGSWTKMDGDFAVVAKEPGDDKADGVFRFTYLRKTKALLGEWEPNDKKIGTRKFNLPARTFKYDTKLGKYPESSTKLLKESDVENMKPYDLRIMRNEIYARHGYSFKLADMREYFDKLDWYMPMAIDITTKLTKLEKDNAAIIKRYEKYTAEHYDGFGR